jgi:molybdopterin-containing oxidoreductase family membrane subunit
VSNSSGSQNEILFRPVFEFKKGFYITVALLTIPWFLGVYAFFYQTRHGMGVTGLNRPIFWGIFITNFVFFIGISHAGTLISAILRICKAEWRRAITRSAEVITVMVLFFGVLNIILDLGRPDRAMNVILNAKFNSPLLWDVMSISIYLIGSVIYLYLPLIPDIALLVDRAKKRKWFYKILSLGWRGTHKQEKILNTSISVMAVLILPIAISVHTVVSWVFGMTIQPMWHSTIFGPYFVAGAIFSGIAALIIVMAIIRKVYHLEKYIKEVHFNNLGILLLVMTLLWFYFTFAEHLTTYYGSEPTHMKVFWEKLTGNYSIYFWTMVLCCFVIPFPILAIKKLRTIKGTVIASVFITIGMWLERFLIVVPTLINPRLPYPDTFYKPTWVEIAITVGSIAHFILMYIVFTKLFPIVSIWEINEGKELGVKETVDRIKTYLPTEETVNAETS